MNKKLSCTFILGGEAYFTNRKLHFLFSYTAEIGNDECCIKTCSDEQKQLPTGTVIDNVVCNSPVNSVNNF